MKTVKLDKDRIKKAIEDGDGPTGSRILILHPNGEHRITWLESQRQWNPYQNEDFFIGIPALDSEGSGSIGELADDMIKELLSQEISKEGISGKAFWPERQDRLKAIKDICDERDISIIDYADQHYHDDWACWLEEATDWLLSAFLEACNGPNHDLPGLEWQPGQPPLFEFEYA